jgi:uncharacterized protein (DUF1800 family)
VPGATEGKPQGYIDQDVYEAARAFTPAGRTAAAVGAQRRDLPNDGQFVYYEPWHDNYQKRVLAVEFDPNQPPMADGRRVLDLVAEHPGTAGHVCRKLCQRLVADDPPDDLVAVAVDAWTRNRTAPDQVARTVRAIVLSKHFGRTWARRSSDRSNTSRRLLRATAADFTPDHNFLWAVDQTNQRLFGWPTPTGHPDYSGFWLGASVMLNRWTAPIGLVGGWLPTVRIRLLRAMPDAVVTGRQVAEFWARRILGYLPGEPTMGPPGRVRVARRRPGRAAARQRPQVAERVTQLVALIAMTPEFHMR